MSCEPDTAALLRAAGQKVTPQRLLILTSVRHASGHLTASQILEQARRSYPYIDASTVYRTLASAKDLHLVSETAVAGADHAFEWIGGHRHHHLVCRVCGTVTELDENHFEALKASVERDTGFRPDLDHLSVSGICRSCREKAEAEERTAVTTG
jgi:Fe2+ or Zn2+ uptake regulation protein